MAELGLGPVHPESVGGPAIGRAAKSRCQMRLIDGDPQGCRTLEPLRRTVPYPGSTGHCAVPFRHWLAGLPWRGLESDQLSPTYEAGVLPVHHPDEKESRLHDSPIRIVPTRVVQQRSPCK